MLARLPNLRQRRKPGSSTVLTLAARRYCPLQAILPLRRRSHFESEGSNQEAFVSSLYLLLFGISIGILSGLLGIGGGILLIPGLIFLFGYSQAEAQGTSLAVMVPPIGIFAALVYYRNGYVQIPVAGTVALGFALGAYIGAQFVPYLPVVALRLGFGMLLLYLGFMFVFAPASGRSAAALPAGIAAMMTTVVAFILRRRRKPTPPSDEIDYHI